jgi:hypothetical protein
MGGRGRKARNKYQVFSVSVPLELKILLDSWVTPEVSRSEVIAGLIQNHADALAAADAQANMPLEAPRKPRKVPLATPVGQSKGLEINNNSAPQQKPVQHSKKGNSNRLALTAPTLQVLTTTIPRGKKWKPEKYAQAEALLAQGNILTAQGVDYVTQAGEVMSWRTAESLVGFGVLSHRNTDRY